MSLRAYQLRFDDRGTMCPAGVIEPEQTTTVILLDGPVGDATGMGITLEPVGGALQPTSRPLTVVSFPSG
ncbi:anti-sigma factor [Streptomyces sp. NPDC006482]|uniref:anti-sigma factor n=1 Tax=Streptomyces sp. NPDC006482 TaxID=3154306 RepID=UPI0033A33E2A